MPIAVSRFTDATMTSKEYLLDTHKRIRCFVSEDSAKSFLKNILKISDENLDWFIYTPVLQCTKCSHLSLNPYEMVQVLDALLCQKCYYSS